MSGQNGYADQIEMIIAQAKQCSSQGAIHAICSHTDDLMPDDIFVAQGEGVQYIDLALQAGACLVLCQGSGPSHPKIIYLKDLDRLLIDLLQAFYAKALKAVALLGVTGTNGKTSTAYFTACLLTALGKKTGYIGTLGYGLVNAVLRPCRNTTPELVSLYCYIAQLAQQGCQCIALEVSSHGIAGNRIAGLNFAVGGFSNLSPDHLDFHGSMENYQATKRRFFTDYTIASLVCNLDDAFGNSLYEQWHHFKSFPCYGVSKTYGVSRTPHDAKNQIRYQLIGNTGDGRTQIAITFSGDCHTVVLYVNDRFNIENSLLAVGFCLASGFTLADVVQVIDVIQPLPGRMQYFPCAQQADVYIDYAHTPDSVKGVLSQFTKNAQADNQWCVLGCGGDRDRSKRPVMAKNAHRYADHLLLCDDNPRYENPTQIILDMLSGIEAKPGLVICRDRRQAIHYVLTQASTSDHIMILGKGDETLLDYGTHQLTQKDQTVVQQFRQSP